MPFINLIEEQRIQRRADVGKSRTALIVFSLVTAVTTIGTGSIFLASEALDASIATLQNEAKKRKPMIDEIESAQTDLSKMNPKITTLENAHAITAKWDRILNHLTVQTPQEIWLTNLRVTAIDMTKPIEITFNGMGSELNKIGEYILRLQSCEDLEGVSLKYTQEKLAATGVGIEFEINATVAGSAEEEEVLDEDKKEEEAK